MKNISIRIAALFATAPLAFSQEAMTPSTSAQAPAVSTVNVNLKVGTDVQDRAVVGEAATFAAGTESLVAWTQVTGAQEPVTLTHVWIYKGETVATVDLDVKSSFYRTWSRKTVAGASGDWKVEVKTQTGEILASQTFTVEPGPAPAQ